LTLACAAVAARAAATIAVARCSYPGNFKDPYQLCSDADAATFVNPSPSSPFVLMIDRGGTDCTFVSKVRRAQHLGAAGAIIVDDRCQCT
jgi:PA domain